MVPCVTHQGFPSTSVHWKPLQSHQHRGCCFGQSEAELALEVYGDTTEPRKPVRCNPCTQTCFYTCGGDVI